MSISYNVRPNALTSPPSYSCQVEANLVLYLDDIAKQISINNPVISASTAKIVIEALRSEVFTQLLLGNTVNIKNFISFVATLPVKLTLPTDPLPNDSLDIVGKVSRTFKQEMRAEASFTRLGYPIKNPQIISAWDTNTEMQGWIRNASPFQIQGIDLGISSSDEDTGIYLFYSDGTNIKQENIGLISPSTVIFVPEFTLPQDDETSITIEVRGRYTPAGQIRTFQYANRVRATNEGRFMFKVADGNSPVNYEAQVGGVASSLIQFVAIVKPDDSVTIAVGPIDGELGPEVVLTEDADDIPLIGVSPAPILINVTDFDLLKENITLYQKYMREVVELQVV